MQNVKDIDVKGKKVLVRCDFNVPLDPSGNILDDFRIRQSLPTIQYLLEKKAKVIIMSHLGEGGESLAQVKKHLDEMLGVHVELLENLRNNPGEVNNDPHFAKQLAGQADIYVNDAFSVCHRAHASVVAITQFLPSVAGLLLRREVENLGKILAHPKKPIVALVGGVKVHTKANFIDEISEIADSILVSGPIQKEIAAEQIAIPYPEKIMGPVGPLDSLDINNETIELFTQKILSAHTIIWNGPFGKFEEEKYEKGTLAIANAIIKSGAFSVVGGGETIEFLRKKGMIDQFSHVSGGGGAMLAFLSGETLPGLVALEY